MKALLFGEDDILAAVVDVPDTAPEADRVTDPARRRMVVGDTDLGGQIGRYRVEWDNDPVRVMPVGAPAAASDAPDEIAAMVGTLLAICRHVGMAVPDDLARVAAAVGVDNGGVV